MISKEQIVRINFDHAQLKQIKEMAAQAAIGGVSRIRNPEDRQGKLSEDQLIGQIAHAAGSLHFFGNLEAYKTARFYANLYPKLGDKGYDIPGCNLDFKGSKIRNAEKPLGDYNLLVRPHERHKDWVYVLVLVNLLYQGDDVTSSNAYLMGWAVDSALPSEVETDGIFKGAYALRAKDLNPLIPLKWCL